MGVTVVVIISRDFTLQPSGDFPWFRWGGSMLFSACRGSADPKSEVPLSSSGGGGGTDPQNIVMMRLFRAVKCLRAIRAPLKWRQLSRAAKKNPWNGNVKTWKN